MELVLSLGKALSANECWISQMTMRHSKLYCRCLPVKMLTEWNNLYFQARISYQRREKNDLSQFISLNRVRERKNSLKILSLKTNPRGNANTHSRSRFNLRVDNEIVIEIHKNAMAHDITYVNIAGKHKARDAR